jgi:tetratricopeptide (TPR) repeat protein
VLGTLVHEVAHHHDFTMRVARGRWLHDSKEKSEIYAERIQHEWVQTYVVPYLEDAYPVEVAALGRWMLCHGGIALPLALLAGDVRSTAKGGGIYVSAILGVPQAFGELAAAVARGDDPVATRLGFARDLHYVDRYGEALTVLESVLLADPSNAEALVLKGDISVHQERYSLARELAEQALSIDGANTDAWEVLADACKAMRDWQGVQLATTRALGSDRLVVGRRRSLLLQRARARVELGNTVGAEADLDSLPQIRMPDWARRDVEELRARIATPKDGGNGTEDGLASGLGPSEEVPS